MIKKIPLVDQGGFNGLVLSAASTTTQKKKTTSDLPATRTVNQFILIIGRVYYMPEQNPRCSGHEINGDPKDDAIDSKPKETCLFQYAQ